jgi:hypothetical protein
MKDGVIETTIPHDTSKLTKVTLKLEKGNNHHGSPAAHHGSPAAHQRFTRRASRFTCRASRFTCRASR